MNIPEYNSFEEWLEAEYPKSVRFREFMKEDMQLAFVAGQLLEVKAGMGKNKQGEGEDTWDEVCWGTTRSRLNKLMEK